MKFKDKKLKFELKQVSQSKVAKALRKMKKKKSAGIDGLSQESLVITVIKASVLKVTDE